MLKRLICAVIWIFVAAGLTVYVQHEWASNNTSTGAAIGDIPGAHRAAIQMDRKAAAFKRATGEKAISYAARVSETIHLMTYHCEPQEYRISWLDWVRHGNYPKKTPSGTAF